MLNSHFKFSIVILILCHPSPAPGDGGPHASADGGPHASADGVLPKPGEGDGNGVPSTHDDGSSPAPDNRSHSPNADVNVQNNEKEKNGSTNNAVGKLTTL